MSWDITIRRPDGRPIGDREEVCKKIASSFPGVQFYREPSGLEKIAAHPGVVFPDIVREALERSRAKLQGDFNQDSYSLRFHICDEIDQEVRDVTIECRGKSQPSNSMMESLTLVTDWIIVDEYGDTIFEGGVAAPHLKSD